MGAYFVSAILLLFIAAGCFWGFKKTVLKAYYWLKAVLIKSVEYIIRSVLAFFGISGYIWMSWGLLFFANSVVFSEQTARGINFILLAIYGWLITMLLYRNFRDDMLKDEVRLVLSRVERKLCFNRRDLTLYPEEWSDCI